MVRGLQRCLALRAVVARGLRRRLVAFGFDDAPVLHGHPNAAFHLAAATAARADALDLGRFGLRNLVLSERGSVACSADGRCGGGCSRQFRERATCHSQLPHESSSLFVCVPGERWVGDAPCAMMYRTLRRWRSACRAPLGDRPLRHRVPSTRRLEYACFRGRAHHALDEKSGAKRAKVPITRFA